MQSSERFLSTGFEALNTLLGGHGLPIGSVTLIRGAPGTGKTTFAVQIAQQALKDGFSIGLVCLEESPTVTLNHITRSYWGVDFKEFFQLNNVNSDNKDVTFDTVGPDNFVNAWKNVQTAIEGESFGFETQLALLWNQLFGPLEHGMKNSSGKKKNLIVIDSLNALIYRAQQNFALKDDREMLGSIIRSLQDWVSIRAPEPIDRPTVIFTAESLIDSHSKDAESYLSDVEISLERKKIKYQLQVAPNHSVPWEEDLLFCQVMKGRGIPVQRRSCCYEFVSPKEGSPRNKDNKVGINFYPTYAAQGLVSLFYENYSQLRVIQELRTVDMPATYPGVVVEEFNKPSLQRIFAIRRYQERIPPRHPLFLSHVDEYWIEVLRGAELLHPISADKLKPFSSTMEEGSIIKELAGPKKRIYLDEKGRYLAIPQMGNVGMLVYRKDLLEKIGAKPPETWEDLEEICIELREHGKKSYNFLLETRSYDTLMATILELGWSHGVFWRTNRKKGDESIRIEFDDKSGYEDFIFALQRLQKWIHDLKIVPPNSTVDPSISPRKDWVFARHWYSTWIDVINPKIHSEEVRKKMAFKPKAKFGIAKIPISEKYKRHQLGNGNENLAHHSCTGEWYLAIQRNSENVELGIDIINNLMTSRKVTERAFSGAEIPLFEKFYHTHGGATCYGTDQTYDDLREMFAKDARSRTEFAHYRKVSRILNGALQAIFTNKNADVRKLVNHAFKEIDPDFS